MSKTLSLRLTIAAILASVLIVLAVQAVSDPTNPYRQADAVAGVVKTVREHYVDELSEEEQEELVQFGLAGIMESLGDPHSGYMPPAQFEEFEHELDGTMVGIGAHVDSREGLVRIVAPIPGSPAAKAGVRPGDLVIEVDGVATLGMDLNDAVDRIKGEPGTQVTLKIRRHLSAADGNDKEDDKELEITVDRGTVQVPAIFGFKTDEGGNPDFMLDPVRGIGYVVLREFTKDSGAQVLAACQQAQASGAKGLIFDMRDNPGGLLTQAVDVSDVFLGKGQTVLSVRYRNADPEIHLTRYPAGIEPGLPVCVLVNEQSASAAEIVAGALKDHQRAYIVGARSYGKGSVQSVFDVPGKLGAVRITIARWYLPSGRLIHRDRKSDSQEWGVDPSEGGYAPIGPDAYFEMLGNRQDFRAGELVLPESGMSESWLREDLGDEQLALAYAATLGCIETGTWPKLSNFDADAAQARAELEALQDQKNSLEKQLIEVDLRLADLIDGNTSGQSDAPGASGKSGLQ